MRFAMLALAGAFTLAATAALADDPMAATYGNTVTTKNAKTGQSAALLFNADGSYVTKATGADGKPVEIPGKWVTKEGGAQICLTPGAPAGAPESCSPLATHAIGEHWTITNTAGDTFDVVITAGR